MVGPPAGLIPSTGQRCPQGEWLWLCQLNDSLQDSQISSSAPCSICHSQEVRGPSATGVLQRAYAEISRLIFPGVISPKEGSATISWPRGNLVPRICYLFGRKVPLACVPHNTRASPSPRGGYRCCPRLSGLPSSPSAKDGITPETLLIMNPIQRASIILVTLCLCLTRRPDQNKAVAPYILIVESDKIRVISICCCPQCGLGPDVPEGDLSCRVFRCPQCESPPLAWKGNHPCLGGLLIVGTCAAPSSERFTGAPLAPRLNRPPAVLGTGVSIFPRGVDTPRVTEAKRKSPTRRIRRFRAAKSEGGLPVRRLGPLCTAASGDGMIPVGRPLSVIPRAFPSIGGAAVSVRIPLCEHGLAKIHHGYRERQEWSPFER